ncbi:MAG: hypothetical protein AAGC69_11870, partial [Paracraurococcus sp.]
AVGDAQAEGTPLVLQLLVCQTGATKISVRIGDAPYRSDVPEDVTHTIVPRVIKRYRQGAYAGKLPMLFLGSSGLLQHAPDTSRPNQQSSRAISLRQDRPAEIFAIEIDSLHWPENVPKLKSFIRDVLDSFLQALERNQKNPFLS